VFGIFAQPPCAIGQGGDYEEDPDKVQKELVINQTIVDKQSQQHKQTQYQISIAQQFE